MDQKISTTPTCRGFLRLPDVLKLIPVSRSRWYDGVKLGEYPRPVKLSANVAAWREDDIRALIERLSEGTSQAKDQQLGNAR